jgi:glucose dehydrogenase
MTTSEPSSVRARRVLTSPAKLTLAMLIGYALAAIYEQAVIFHSWMPPIGLVQLLPTLIVIGLFATGFRWMPLVSAIFLLLPLVLFFPFIVQDLSHPAQDPQDFVWTLLVVLMLLVGIGAGIVAVAQQLRTTEH